MKILTCLSIRIAALVLGMFLLGVQNASAHGVQVAWGIAPGTGLVRVYIEHWHGDRGVRGGDRIRVSVNGGPVQTLSVDGVINNTSVGSLPGFQGVVTSGNRSNRYRDWGFWDFASPVCNVPVTIRVNSGTTVVFTNGSSPSIYPATITGVTITDTAPPVISGNNINTTTNDCVGGLFISDAQLGISVIDDCDPNPSVNVSGIPAGNIFPIGTTTITVNASDNTGKSSSATFTVVVNSNDTTPPDLTCPDSPVLLECDGSGYLAQIAAWAAAGGGSLTVTDNCDPNPTLTSSIVDGGADCGATGSGTVTFTATDGSGNSSTCSVEVVVVDTTAPDVSLAVNDFLPNETPISFTATSSGDACGSVVVAITEVTAQAINGAGKLIDKSESAEYTVNGDTITITDGGGVGTFFTITATATDECGNSSTTTEVATVSRPANEGVGNGVDGNTPGHDNNGGNDDPEFSPGNPGAKHKAKGKP